MSVLKDDVFEKTQKNISEKQELNLNSDML